MNEFLTLEQIKQIEVEVLNNKLNLIDLAGVAIFTWIKNNLPATSKIIVLIGKGNNGSDGLSCAIKLLQNGFSVTVLLVMNKINNSSKILLEKFRNYNGLIIDEILDDFNSYDVIIDAILGIGINNDIDTNLKVIINKINAVENKKVILAVDTPTGLNPFSGEIYSVAIKANQTITFITNKPGFYTGDAIDIVGNVIVMPLINIKEYKLSRVENSIQINNLNTIDYKALIRDQQSTSKGNFGTVAIIGGSKGMTGALCLAGRSAMLLGSGKVVLGFVDNEFVVDNFMPELIIQSVDDIINNLEKFTALVVGPGLGTDLAAVEIINRILGQKLKIKIIFDADALNILALNSQLAQKFSSLANKIITPHPGEAARLLSITVEEVQHNRFTAVNQLYTKFKAITLLKGAGSLIQNNINTFINCSGNVALSSAGEGDTLCGMIAAFLSCGLELIDALRFAVYLHGLAADNLSQVLHGYNGILASEVAYEARQLLNNILYL